MNKSVLDRIAASKKKLGKVAEALKRRFVGLDKIIDSIIDNMMVWHSMPEIVGRPIIINLWGMTGVGKTDLVRNLARELEMADNFVEIQMSNKSQSESKTVQSILARSAIEPDAQGILLLDEVQRYRTVNDSGAEVHDHEFQDVWMLLSDGKFAGNGRTKTELMDMLLEDIYYKQNSADWEKERELNKNTEVEVEPCGTKKPKKDYITVDRKYKMGMYSARELKRTLHLKEELADIMQWDDVKKMKVVEARINDQETFEGNSYKQLLIFISGNLDEAYEMSGSTHDADIDADVFHDFSTRINLVTIKRVLRTKFKPEQIARLGNVHIIYPSLDKASYSEIIRRKIQEIIESVNGYGVHFKIGQSVYDAIYRNGVFPAQGVRPVLSSVNAMLGNAIPHFLLIAAEQQEKVVSLEHEGIQLIAEIGGKKYYKTVEGSIDKIKKSTDPNQIAVTAVHEAGHAVIYAALFGLSPVQMVANSSTSDNNGWIGIHKNCYTSESIHDIICTNLAGLAAEELIFGEKDRTSGCSGDISMATSLAGYAIRQWAMNGHISLRVNKFRDDSQANYNLARTDDEIETYVRKEKTRALETLECHRALFEDTAHALMKDKELSAEEFQKLAKSHGLEIEIKSPKEMVYSDYVEQFKVIRANAVKDA